MFLAAVLVSCGPGAVAKPELPESVSPGWKLGSFGETPVPPGVPAGAQSGKPTQCWKGQYSGTGTADVTVCGYAAESGAFDAAQRAVAEAQTVKFQEGRYLVLVGWNAVPKASLTALIREIQRTLKPK